MRMSQEQIRNSLDQALKEEQFVIYIQPQYNHSNKALIGGEALVRWFHPEHGMQSPADFIPIFEETGQIPRLDLYVFEQVCKYQKSCIDRKEECYPISFNVSREDLQVPDYIDSMERIRQKYDVPVSFLRVEITESSAVGSIDFIVELVDRLHRLGYLVEMDDFGSGYSSLNVLKDLKVDIIKLDLKFFAGEVGGRGGIIISSVVNMAKWLNTPVIAEGVETKDQADYMLSIGCELIQGFYYSRPLPTEEFHKLTAQKTFQKSINPSQFIENLDTGRFWNPESLETLIFSNFVGGAAILLYSLDGTAEILRINNKYLREISMNLMEKDILSNDPWKYFDEENKKIYQSTLEKAIKSKDEEECETWRTFVSGCCSPERLCILSSMQLIGTMENKYLFYIMIRNITREKRIFNEVYASDQRLRAASEQANIYAWEYCITTKEMRPCFRCMRDLGVPAVVENYPEPLIDAGIFPPDYADMYRDWMRQIDAGAPSMEGVIPLTVGRIPFLIRYTTEFDENGRPVKAYGSARLIETTLPVTDPTGGKKES